MTSPMAPPAVGDVFRKDTASRMIKAIALRHFVLDSQTIAPGASVSLSIEQALVLRQNGDVSLSHSSRRPAPLTPAAPHAHAAAADTTQHHKIDSGMALDCASEYASVATVTPTAGTATSNADAPKSESDDDDEPVRPRRKKSRQPKPSGSYERSETDVERTTELDAD